MNIITQLAPCLALLFAVRAVHAQQDDPSDACATAFSECRFSFLDSPVLRTFALGDADKPFTPLIVSRTAGDAIGILNSNAVSPQFIGANGVATDVAELGSGFTPSQFKPFSIAHTVGSGIGHETFQGNAALASARCVRVFFTSYQKLVRVEPVAFVENVHLTPQQAVSTNSCVVFRTA